MELPIDITGWIGMVLIVIAYYMVSNNKIKAQSNLFQVINLIGSTFIGINAFYYGALPSVGVNIVWFLISAFALVKINSRKRHST
jgi:hypothetical protein